MEKWGFWGWADSTSGAQARLPRPCFLDQPQLYCMQNQGPTWAAPTPVFNLDVVSRRTSQDCVCCTVKAWYRLCHTTFRVMYCSRCKTCSCCRCLYPLFAQNVPPHIQPTCPCSGPELDNCHFPVNAICFAFVDSCINGCEFLLRLDLIFSNLPL